MYLSILRLWNFRKYGTGADNAPGLEVHFHEGVNVLIGKNELLQVPYGQAGHKSLRTEEDKPHQSLRVQVLCKQSGISVPAKWIRTARHYQLNIYTDNKSYQNPFTFTDG